MYNVLIPVINDNCSTQLPSSSSSSCLHLVCKTGGMTHNHYDGVMALVCKSGAGPGRGRGGGGMHARMTRHPPLKSKRCGFLPPAPASLPYTYRLQLQQHARPTALEPASASASTTGQAYGLGLWPCRQPQLQQRLGLWPWSQPQVCLLVHL